MIALFIILAEFIWQKVINYPPTIDQLNLGVHNQFTLWMVRAASLLLILISINLISKNVSSKSKRYFWIIVLATPVLSLIWMAYPLDALAMFLSCLIFFIFQSKKFGLFIAVMLATAAMVFVNLFVLKQNPSIVNSMSLNQSQKEVTFRFNIEDNLKPNIYVPLIIKRIVYNKFYIAFKNSANESMHFFDFETLFFQEVHPLLQKAFVTFFWPEILIFALSLWLIVNRKIRLSNNFYAILFLAFVYFITTNYSSDRRLIFAVFPISMLMSAGVEKALSEKKGLLKPAAIILIFLTIYGWATNYFDRYVRADYWLDNRPLAYNFFFSYIKSHAQNYDQIVVSDTLYAAPTYCAFYITACDRIKVQNFDTFDSKPQPNTLYVGFTGNFLGPNRENADINQIISTANSEGLEVYDSKSILNNIASGYGQELVIAGPRK